MSDTPDDTIHNAIKVAQENEELKLLTRDERKEYKVLREILTELTPFQVKFVEAYIKTASAAQAARIAGTKSSTPEITGYTALKNPKVQQAIAIAMKKRIEAVGLDTIEVIQKIREVYTTALAASNYAAAIKACELLQKEVDKANGLMPTAVGNAKIKAVAVKKEEKEEKDEDLEKVISILSKSRGGGVQ